MYMHMLGYPTHFGQMETLKLVASNDFVDKVWLRLSVCVGMQLIMLIECDSLSYLTCIHCVETGILGVDGIAG